MINEERRGIQESLSGVDPQQHLVAAWQVDNIAALGHLASNVLRSLNAPQLNEARPSSPGRIRDEPGRLALTLCPDDSCLSLLHSNAEAEVSTTQVGVSMQHE